MKWKKWADKVIRRSTTQPDLKSASLPYFNMGLAVVPIKLYYIEEKKEWKKQPLIDWAIWKKRQQTVEEFENLKWNEANGFGIILDLPTKDGVYVVVVDYDTKKISEEAKIKGKEILELFPETRTEKTISDGLHYLYFSSEKIKNNKEYHDLCGFELFGEGLIIMAPSYKYQIVDKREILKIGGLTEIFTAAIQKILGRKEKKEKRKKKEIKKIRPCIQTLLKNRKLSHEQRCIVAFEYLNAGFQLKDVVDLFRNQTDFDVEETTKQLEHAIEKDYLPYSEERLKELGLCLGPECKQYGKSVIYTPSMVFEDGRICEEGYDGKKVYYIVYEPKTQTITQVDFLETEEEVYMPILNFDVQFEQVYLPSAAEEYESDIKLETEIKVFLDRWHEQIDPIQRNLDVNYARETWVKDLLPQVGYRRALAKWGSGKSTFLEVLGSICYRGFSLAGCSTEAAIRRTFDIWKGTAIIDEADFGRSDLYAVIVKILNIGFDSKGFYKCCDDKDPKKVLSFYVYGPKIIATRERYGDTALESRCLTFFGRRNIKPIPLYRMEKFKKESLELRNKLLMWRLKNYHKLKEKLPLLEQMDAEEKIYGETLNVVSRVKQLVLPLLLIIEDKESRKNLVEFARKFDANLQNLDEEKMWEDQIENAIRGLFKLDGTGVSLVSVVSGICERGDIYQIYLYVFSDVLEIPEENRGKFNGGLARYFRKRTDFPIRAGGRNKKYILMPKFYITAILQKKSDTLPYDANNANTANIDKISPKEKDGWRYPER